MFLFYVEIQPWTWHGQPWCGPENLPLEHSISYRLENGGDWVEVDKLNEEDKSDILILTETFCSAKVPNGFYSTPGFHIYCTDRIGRCGGMILAFVNSSLQVKRREDHEETDLE